MGDAVVLEGPVDLEALRQRVDQILGAVQEKGESLYSGGIRG